MSRGYLRLCGALAGAYKLQSTFVSMEDTKQELKPV